MDKRLLIVDDDIDLNHLLAQYLSCQGFEVFSARTGLEGLRLAFRVQPDLVILDVMMPEMDGWQTCERLRAFTDVPVIMLTALDEPVDLAHGFSVGADDYITKPFGLAEVRGRVCAVLRRVNPTFDPTMTHYDDGFLRIDLRGQCVFRDRHLVHLTQIEFLLLACLVRHRGAPVSHQHLSECVWGEPSSNAKALVSTHICRLRKKLQAHPRAPQYIHTRWSVGYSFGRTISS